VTRDTRPSKLERMTSRFESLGRRVLAFFILLIAGWIVLKFVIHIAAAVFGVVLVILAIVAVIWAVRTLF
jgi:protein-S-isoprenylcysteine O-methyltransferase Ste14